MVSSDQEFRRYKRVVFTTPAPVATAPGAADRIEEATTIDLSESGVRLRISGLVEPGQIVEVFLAKQPERCRVVWTNAPGAHKDLIAGLEFLFPVPGSPTPSLPPESRIKPTG